MSQAEAYLQAGCTLTANVRDPVDDYSLLASALPVTESPAGIYRINTGVLTGIVKVDLLLNGHLFAYGFANLSRPGANEYSELVDTLAQATGPVGAISILPGRDVGKGDESLNQIEVYHEAENILARAVVDAEGNPIDLRDKDLQFVIQNARGVDIVVVSSEDITVSGSTHNTYSFAIPTAASAKIGIYEYSLNDLTTKSLVVGGKWVVRYRALADS